MNEPSNFQMTKDRPKGDAKNKLNFPPFKVGLSHRLIGSQLEGGAS